MGRLTTRVCLVTVLSMSPTDTTLEPERKQDQPILLSRSDMAARLGLSTATLDELRRAEGLPHVVVGRRIMFRRESVDAWLRAREVSR